MSIPHSAMGWSVIVADSGHGRIFWVNKEILYIGITWKIFKRLNTSTTTTTDCFYNDGKRTKYIAQDL